MPGRAPIASAATRGVGAQESITFVSHANYPPDTVPVQQRSFGRNPCLLDYFCSRRSNQIVKLNAIPLVAPGYGRQRWKGRGELRGLRRRWLGLPASTSNGSTIRCLENSSSSSRARGRRFWSG